MADAFKAPGPRLGQLGGYELCRVLHEGQRCIAYDAIDAQGTAVTLTTLRGDPFALAPLLRSFAADRFLCFAAFLDLGTEHGQTFVVTAPVLGESAEQMLERSGPLSPSVAARIALELCRDFETAGAELPLYRALSSQAARLWRDEHGHLHCQLLLTTLLERWLDETTPEDAQADAASVHGGAEQHDEVSSLVTWLGQIVGQANIVASPLLADVLERAFEPSLEGRPRDRRQLVDLLTPLTRTLSGPVATQSQGRRV